MKLHPFVFAFAIVVGGPSCAEPAKSKEMSFLEIPRYRASPVDFFFEQYILDVLGELPAARSHEIQAMNLQKIFKTRSNDWHDSVRETLHLSGTINIAILDLWYRNQDIARTKKVKYPPQQFAMDFVDEYMKDGSQVDVWGPGALVAAKARIAQQRATARRAPHKQ
jgi:hypothetical protein